MTLANNIKINALSTFHLRSIYAHIYLDVRNETSLFPSSLRHVMLQYFGIFQPSSGIMMTHRI